MGDFRYKKALACGLSSSSSRKLLLYIVPLMVVSGLVATLAPKTSSWDFISSYRYTTTGSSNGTASSHEKKSEGAEDLHPMGMVVGVPNTKDQDKAVFDESLLHRSSFPQLPAVEAVNIQESNATKEDAFNSSRNGGVANESSSDVDGVTMRTRGRKECTKLARLEGGLQTSRLAMKEAKYGNRTHDPNFAPLGPMYWNANVFHRSYLEMEKHFKVFVYEEGEPPVFHNGPCKSIYSTEGNFIHMMEINAQFRTKDPDKAHVFFLPFSVVMMVRFVYVRDSHNFGPIRKTVKDYVDLVARKYPYWNRSLGADHFMLSCHDWGPRASFSVPRLGKNSIHALCNANTSEGFRPTKDVSFPEINLLTGTTKGFIGGPSVSKRPILAFFAGRLHGPIRPIVLEHWENKDEDIRVYQNVPKGVSYYEMMRKSKFCLCPSGYEVASPRIVEAVYTGCVPVLISEHYVPPFSDVLNWKTFSVEVPVRDIPNLKKILTNISTRQYSRMQKRVVQIRRHFEVNSPPQRFDVFHMILHSVWLRRLNVRVDNDPLGITRLLKKNAT